MTTIAAQRLSEALSKAKQVGAVEDGLTIMGCPIVLQSLRPKDYEDILAQIEELDDVAYYNAYQLEHVSRALVELDGQDLRSVDYIEDEAPAGFLVWATLPSEELALKLLKHVKEAGGDAGISPSEDKRQVKYERHEWLKRKVLSTWGREAVTVAWQKFAELLVTADERAKEGIEFRIPDESGEDKLRRLLGELTETFEGLPVELVDNVLKDSGLMRQTTISEMRKATERLDELARDVEQQPEAPEAFVPAGPPQPVAPTVAPTTATAEELMRSRSPLNQQAVSPPVPASSETNPQPARPRPKVPEQLRQAAAQNTAGLSKRAASIAQLEAAVDPSVLEEAQQPLPSPQPPEEVPMLEKVDPLEPAEAVKIFEQPPVAGINPRYRPPQR